MAVNVRQRKGACWVVIRHQGIPNRGHCRWKRVGTGKSGKRAAETAAEKIQARLALGDFSILQDEAKTAPTLREYADHWLRSEAAIRLKPITLERYEIVLNRHLLPAFGDIRLSELSRPALKRQLAAWLTNGKIRGRGGLKPGTVRLLVATLRTILNAAVEDGLISTNPAARLGRFVRSDGAEDEAPDPFTAEEVSQILHTAEREYPEWRPFFLTLARTGLRI